MGYEYGYGYRSGGGAFGAVFLIMMLAALVGSIVVTYIAYKRYVREPNKKLSNLITPEGLRSFLRFDTLLIERIITVLYIFNAVFVAAMDLAMVISMLFLSPAAAFGLLFGSIIMLPLAELLIRLTYENVMLRVITARNTTDIKRAMGISDDSGNMPGEDLPTTPTNPQAPAAKVADPVPATPQVDDWPAHEARHAGSPFPGQGQLPNQNQLLKRQQATCPACGTVLRKGVRFCPACGTHVEL